jgi:hypothetical protein
MYGTYIGKQEMETKLLKELCKFTSIPGESIESYYLRFSKIMNDLSRHNLSQTSIANNTNFLNELQPEWGRYVTIVYQKKNLHEVTYDQLYDFLKQNQDEANEVRAELLAKKHDPLALMANTPTPLPVNTQQQPSSSSTHNYMQPSYIQQPTPVYQQQFYPQQQHVIPQQQYLQFQLISFRLVFVSKVILSCPILVLISSRYPLATLVLKVRFEEICSMFEIDLEATTF